MTQKRIEKAFSLFDDYNKQDPHQVEWKGESFPAEYFYSLKLHEWITKLEPDASEYLLLASRSQHIGRWEIPRDTYPSNKAGYLNWRIDLGKYHAQKTAEILSEIGYGEDEIEKVKHIILKQQIKADPEVQAIENALCLVFLEFQYEDFISKHDDAKLIRILQKTWKKMSGPGQQEALKLPYSEKGLDLIKQALA